MRRSSGKERERVEGELIIHAKALFGILGKFSRLEGERERARPLVFVGNVVSPWGLPGCLSQNARAFALRAERDIQVRVGDERERGRRG